MKVQHIFNAFLMLFLFFGSSVTAQSLSRQTIFSTASSNLVDGVWISQTIGQSYNTATNYSNGISYRPGFQQPASKKANKIVDNQLPLVLFPNPVVTSFTVQSPEVIPIAIIKVVDVNGTVVYSNSVTNLTTHKIDCQQWAAGTYVLSVSNGRSNIYSSAVIVNH